LRTQGVLPSTIASASAKHLPPLWQEVAPAP